MLTTNNFFINFIGVIIDINYFLYQMTKDAKLLHFPIFGLNLEMQSVNFHIPPEYGKIWIRKNFIAARFSRSDFSHSSICSQCTLSLPFRNLRKTARFSDLFRSQRKVAFRTNELKTYHFYITRHGDQFCLFFFG